MKYTLQNIHDLAYRWGDQQALLYDPVREDIFSPPYLRHLYQLCRQSGRAKLGILEPLFCGMRDLGEEAICAYLHSLKLVILGEWRKEYTLEDKFRPPSARSVFHPLGFCFLTTLCEGKTTRAGFGAYGFFREAWGTDQQHVCTLLGIAYLFAEWNLSSLHGIRYSDNSLTAKWMAKFGFVDLCTLPDYLVRYSTGELTAATISTLSRQVFEERLSAALEKAEEV